MSESATPQPVTRPRLSANGSAPATSSLARPAAKPQPSHARMSRVRSGLLNGLRHARISQLREVVRRTARRP